jgi:hypothetical protein
MPVYLPPPFFIASTAATTANYVTTFDNQNVNGEKVWFSDQFFLSNILISGNIEDDIRITGQYITLNEGEISTEVTSGEAGLLIDRGTGGTSKLLFKENSAGGSDNRWYIDNGDGNTLQILYNYIPDDTVLNGKVWINNDLQVNYDVIISDFIGNENKVLTVDSSGRLILSNKLVSDIGTGSGSGVGFIPLEGDGIIISASGSNYIFSVDNNSLNTHFVNITGDTMTGNLSVPTIDITGYASLTPKVDGEVPWQEGRVFYCDDDKTLCYYNDNNQVKVNVGQEQIIRVVNKTGSDISNGQVVYINGSQGNRPTIALADADLDSSHRVIGLATCDIPNNNNGYVTTEGLVRDVNTNGWIEGTELWLSQTAGAYTATKPTAPIHQIRIGYVLRQGTTDGIIFVKVDTGFDLQGLHDVLITSATSGDLITWNGQVWVNDYNINDYTPFSITSSISGDLQSQINGKANTIHNHTSVDITDFSEAVDDRVSNLLVAGTNISFSYNDVANTLTINSTTSGSALLQGIVECDTSNSLYTINHPLVDPNYSNPTISLLIPTSGSNIFVQGITNIQNSSFQVSLSEIPNISGYKIFWHLPSTSSAILGTSVVNQQMTTLPSITTSTSGNYTITFTDTVVYADNNNTILLPATPSTNEHHWIVNTYGADITVNGNGKNIWIVGINNATAILPPDSSIHLHYNVNKDKWFII